MGLLPMVPSGCSLDEPALRDQLARYRGAGRGAVIVERSRRRVAVRVADAIPDRTVEELVAVERRCCPFFALDWDPSIRQLRVSVSKPDDEPALAAIADALGMNTGS